MTIIKCPKCKEETSVENWEKINSQVKKDNSNSSNENYLGTRNNTGEDNK